MTPRIRKTPAVDPQIADIYLFILQDKVTPAEPFLEMIDEAFALLAERPSIGILHPTEDPRLQNIRIYPMPSPYRNYLIIYRPLEDGIKILLVCQGARNLDFLIRRSV